MWQKDTAESGNLPTGRQEWITKMPEPLRSDKFGYLLVERFVMHAMAQALGFDVDGIFPGSGVLAAFFDFDYRVVNVVGDDGFLGEALGK